MMFGLLGEHISRIPILHSHSISATEFQKALIQQQSVNQIAATQSISQISTLFDHEVTNMEIVKSNAQSMTRSPLYQRGALIDKNSYRINFSGNSMLQLQPNPNLNPVPDDLKNEEEFDRFTGAGYGRRLRRMRRNRRRLFEQQRMLSAAAASASDSGSNSTPDQLVTAAAATSRITNNDNDFLPSDEERISNGVKHFLFDKGQENQQHATIQEGSMNLCDIICHSEDELEYGLEKTNEIDVRLYFNFNFNDLNDQRATATATEVRQPESARMRGQHQPLTIASPNTDDGFNGILATNYRIYTIDSVQYTNAPVHFYIEPKQTYGLYTIPFEPHHFAIMINTKKDNVNLTYQVHMDNDDYLFEGKDTGGEFCGPFYQKRLKCRFEPREPGNYPITVCLAKYGHVWNPKHVEGSPLCVTVKGNFKNLFAKPLGLACAFVTLRLPLPANANSNSSVPAVRLVAAPAPAPAKPGPSSAFPRFKSPAKRHAPTTTNKNHNASNSNSNAPANMAKPMSMMEVTNYNGMFYYNHRPIVVKTTPPSAPQLNTKPWGITYCPRNDELFVTARDLHQIQRYSAATGGYLGHFGAYGSGPDCFFRPTGIVYDQNNNRLVITDKDNHRVCFYTVCGQLISTFGSVGHFPGLLNYPWGVDVSRDGTLIVVADSRNHRIQIFTSTGQFLRLYSVFEINPFEYKDIFNYPRGVCFDNSGQFIYVSDFNNNAVFAINIECTAQSVMTQRGQCLRPQGLVLDYADNLFICDTKRLCIRVVRPDGSPISTIEGFGRPSNHNQEEHQPGDKEFILQDVPIDVCLVRSGKLAVLDANGIVRIF